MSTQLSELACPPYLQMSFVELSNVNLGYVEGTCRLDNCQLDGRGDQTTRRLLVRDPLKLGDIRQRSLQMAPKVGLR